MRSLTLILLLLSGLGGSEGAALNSNSTPPLRVKVAVRVRSLILILLLLSGLRWQ